MSLWASSVELAKWLARWATGRSEARNAPDVKRAEVAAKDRARHEKHEDAVARKDAAEISKNIAE